MPAPRLFLLPLLALLLPGPLSAGQASIAPPRTPVIVNQAADGIVGYLFRKLKPSLGKGASREQALAGLHQIVDQYQGTGVSHLFWNVNYQRAAYASAVWPSYWDVPNPEQNVTEWPRGFYELHKLEIDDVFARLIPRSRERGISPWISLRMNDHHYTQDPTRVSPLFFEHPALRTRGGNGLFNYARPEVRDHYLKLAAEVLARYDVDGLELDWIRTPDNFDAADAERGREILTGFVREVRRQTRAAAARLGHPVRLAVRVPATPAFARGKGFEAVAWAREGLIDLLIPSDWWSGCADIPVEEWREEIGPDAPPCLIVPFTASTYACTPKGFSMNRNLAATRGFAASMLDRGAGGIYFFNHFDPVANSLRVRNPAGEPVKEGVVGDLFRAAASLADAARGARVHALTIHDCQPGNALAHPLPAVLSRETPLTVRIHTGPPPASGRGIVRVGLDGPEPLASAELALRFNARACRYLADEPAPVKADPRPEQPRQHVSEVAPRVLQFEVPLSEMVRGYNQLDVRLLRGASSAVTWLEIALEP